MRGKTIWCFAVRAAVLGAIFALGGCGANSGLFSSSKLDVFSTSSKATTGTGDTAAGEAAAASDIDCPEITIRTGAATLMIAGASSDGGPSALDLRYQGSIIRTARECHVNSGVMTMKVGVEGRVVTGPAGGPGEVIVPLRLALVQEGVNPKTIVSKLVRIPVTVTAAIDRVSFTYIDPDISFPLPIPRSAIDTYVVYVGFDAAGAPPQKKTPEVKRKPAAKKPIAKPAG
jgi:hypothetical protein